MRQPKGASPFALGFEAWGQRRRLAGRQPRRLPLLGAAISRPRPPTSYATIEKNRTRLLLIHGTNDDVVDPPSQSQAFLIALNQASIGVRRIIIPGAGHFWASDPFESEPGGYGATTAPRPLRFLGDALYYDGQQRLVWI